MNIFKRIASITTAAALASTLCLGLIGCEPNKENFTGVWQVSTIDGTSIDQINSWASSTDTTITLNEDGTAKLKTSSTSFFGGSASDSVEASWKAMSDTEFSITDEEGGTVTGNIHGDVLTITMDGRPATFKRV